MDEPDANAAGPPTRAFYLGASAERLVSVAERFLPPGARTLTGAFTIADADLALLLQRLVHHRDPCPERLATYAREIFRRPSIREWLAHTRWQDR